MVKRSQRKGRRERVRKSVGPGRFISWSSALFRRPALYTKRHWVAVRSVLIFAGCILLFMFIYSRTAGGEQLLGFRTLIANATGATLSLIYSNVQVIGTNVSSPDFSMGIITACTGLVAMVIFTAAVLAYPCSLGKKTEGIVLGAVGIFIFNLLRMVGLFMVGSHLPGLFNSAHYIVGQSLMILLAIGLWLLWLEKRVHIASR